MPSRRGGGGDDTSTSGRSHRSHRSKKSQHRQNSGSSVRSATTANSTRPLTAGPVVDRDSEAVKAMVFQTSPDDGVVDAKREKLNRDPTKWTNALCGCGTYPDTCWYGLCCVPCAVATAVHRFDNSSWCLNCCCNNVCTARNYIRSGYRIDGHVCGDCCLGCLCGPCVAVQILNETEERGAIIGTWDQHPYRTSFQQPWKFGLCSCYEDCLNCMYGSCCGPCATGSIRHGLDGTDCFFSCILLNVCTARSMVRMAYNIEGNGCNDAMTATCCYPCALCQLLNEVQHRGRIDMTSRGVINANIEMANYMRR